MSGAAFDPGPMLAALDKHRVEYVLVGGYAAYQHGAQRPTYDIDVTPATTAENLTRLAAALKELRAGIRVDDLDEGLPFDTSAEALAGMRTLNLRTPYGDLDLTFTPDGTDGYADLVRAAQERTIEGVTVRVAALADVIRSKRAANRAKDLEALPELMLLERGQRRPSRSRQRPSPAAAEPPPPYADPTF
jgi:hypothetical protein